MIELVTIGWFVCGILGTRIGQSISSQLKDTPSIWNVLVGPIILIAIIIVCIELAIEREMK